MTNASRERSLKRAEALVDRIARSMLQPLLDSGHKVGRKDLMGPDGELLLALFQTVDHLRPETLGRIVSAGRGIYSSNGQNKADDSRRAMVDYLDCVLAMGSKNALNVNADGLMTLRTLARAVIGARLMDLM